LAVQRQTRKLTLPALVHARTSNIVHNSEVASCGTKL